MAEEKSPAEHRSARQLLRLGFYILSNIKWEQMFRAVQFYNRFSTSAMQGFK